MDATLDLRAEIREFLRSRRARIAPEMAGLPAYGGRRRVEGLRREEVALLAGVSVEYYVRIERGGLAGTSEGVLDALATALQLNEAEREHLFDLARQSGAPGGRPPSKPPATVRPALQEVLDAMTGAPALIRNARHDLLAMNPPGRALYSPVLADSRRPANTARFVYLHPREAEQFFVDYDHAARNAAAMLRMEVGRNPHDEALIALVGELSAGSEQFRQQWASQDVRIHRTREQTYKPSGRGPDRLELRVHGSTHRAWPAVECLHRTCGRANRRQSGPVGVVGQSGDLGDRASCPLADSPVVTPMARA